MDASLQLALLGRASLAALLGFAIGLEREFRGKSAGDRTFALLAFAAAAVTGIGAEVLGPDGASRVIRGGDGAQAEAAGPTERSQEADPPPD